MRSLVESSQFIHLEVILDVWLFMLNANPVVMRLRWCECSMRNVSWYFIFHWSLWAVEFCVVCRWAEFFPLSLRTDVFKDYLSARYLVFHGIYVTYLCSIIWMFFLPAMQCLYRVYCFWCVIIRIVGKGFRWNSVQSHGQSHQQNCNNCGVNQGFFMMIIAVSKSN